MSATDALCQELDRLRRAGGSPPAKALVVVIADGADDAVSVVANELGVAAYRAPRSAYPAAVLPSSGGAGAAGGPQDIELADHPDGFLERRLLLTGYTDDLRQRFGVRRARALSTRGGESGATVVIGSAESVATEVLDRDLGVLAGQVMAILQRSESTDSKLDRLRRLEQVD